MRYLVAFAAAFLATAAQASQDCDHEYLSPEDIAIMASVLPAKAVETATSPAPQPAKADRPQQEAARICWLPVVSNDPQLSPEAGWEPVMRQVNCLTGVILTLKQARPQL
jgi:hypothetical protein